MKNIIFTAVLLLFTACSIASYADIYKYVDENGVTHFTNIPGNKYKKIISVENKNISKPGHKKSHTPSSADYLQIIQDKSRKYNIAPSLVNAVIEVESNWNSTAVSKKGARGLMQLMPSTAREMDIGNPLNPEENIEGGVRYLRHLLDKFNGDLSLALAAYNAGPDKIEKFKGIPPITETRQYVKRVLSLYNGNPGTEKNLSIYKITLNDGGILYTNIPPVNKKTGSTSF